MKYIATIVMAALIAPPIHASDELTCLATGIYFESKSETRLGKVAVAQVILNRVNHPQYPKTICKVIQQKSRIRNRTVCQFSWYCKPNRVITHQELFDESLTVARQVLYENEHIAALANALNFHSVHVNPQWKKRRIKKIGNHIFY